jgi:hypothetical protein
MLCSSEMKSCPASNGWPAAGVPGHLLHNLEQLNWGYFLWRPTRLATLFAADGSVKSSWSASAAAIVQPAQAQQSCSQHKRSTCITQGWTAHFTNVLSCKQWLACSRRARPFAALFGAADLV